MLSPRLEVHNIYKCKTILKEIVNDALKSIDSSISAIGDKVFKNGFYEFTKDDYSVSDCSINFILVPYLEFEDDNEMVSFYKDTKNRDLYKRVQLNNYLKPFGIRFDGKTQGFYSQDQIFIFIPYELHIKNSKLVSSNRGQENTTKYPYSKDSIISYIEHEFTHFIDLGKHSYKGKSFQPGLFSEFLFNHKIKDIDYNDVNIIDNILYRLFSDTERNAFLSTKNIDKYIKDLKSYINVANDTEDDSPIWKALKEFLNTKKVTIKSKKDFIKKASELLEKFKLKHLKDTYNTSKEDTFNTLQNSILKFLTDALGTLEFIDLEASYNDELEISKIKLNGEVLNVDYSVEDTIRDNSNLETDITINNKTVHLDLSEFPTISINNDVQFIDDLSLDNQIEKFINLNSYENEDYEQVPNDKVVALKVFSNLKLLKSSKQIASLMLK